MLVYLIRRLGQSLLVVAVMSTLVFVAIFAIGDPVDILISPDADQVERDAIAKRLGLDQPLCEQFGLFVWRALHGDLGRSFVYNVPAVEVILQRMPATLELALVALAASRSLIGIPLGVCRRPEAALARRPQHHGRLDPRLLAADLLGRADADHGVRGRAAARCRPAGAAPTVTVLGVPIAYPDARRPAAPAPAGAHARALQGRAGHPPRPRRHARGAAAGLRQVRARQGPAAPSRIIGVHVLKNIMIPIVTVIGLEFGAMIAFAVVTETVFAWPGMGKLLIDSINRLDRPVIVAYLVSS